MFFLGAEKAVVPWRPGGWRTASPEQSESEDQSPWGWWITSRMAVGKICRPQTGPKHWSKKKLTLKGSSSTKNELSSESNNFKSCNTALPFQRPSCAARATELTFKICGVAQETWVWGWSPPWIHNFPTTSWQGFVGCQQEKREGTCM